MTLHQFVKISELLAQLEIDKVKLLAFYYHKIDGMREFGRDDISEWFADLSLPQPNIARLMKHIQKSRIFVRGKSKGLHKLHAVTLDELQLQYPGLHTRSEEVVSEETVLPQAIYENSRGFIESLAKQINASYEYNIYDGCAVLMRRLIEILLILTYERLNIDGDIRGSDGNYLMLEGIVSNAKSNPKLRLSRDTKEVLEEFRTLGNFSAHKIYYNCRRRDLQRLTTSYRATIEELLYKAGIRT